VTASGIRELRSLNSFKLPPNSLTTLCNGGSALIVEIAGPRATPGVRTVETGRYHWHQVARTLTDDAQVDLLDAELRALHPDLGKVVLDLQVSGTLSLAGRKFFEERIAENVRAAICGMRLDDTELLLSRLTRTWTTSTGWALSVSLLIG